MKYKRRAPIQLLKHIGYDVRIAESDQQSGPDRNKRIYGTVCSEGNGSTVNFTEKPYDVCCFHLRHAIQNPNLHTLATFYIAAFVGRVFAIVST